MKEFNFYGLKLVKEKSVQYAPITCASEIAQFFMEMIGDEAEEHVVVAGCDNRGHVCCFFDMSRGTVNSAILSVASIFRRLLASNCSSFFVCHNHTSMQNPPEFSGEDLACCDKIKNACDILGGEINLVDFLVVTDTSYTSARREGYL